MVIGALGLLVRESIWIYLFSLTLLNFRKIISEDHLRKAFSFLYGIPLLWFTCTFISYVALQGRVPSVPLEWPFMISKQSGTAIGNPFHSFQSLVAALRGSGALPLLAGILVTLVLVWFAIRHQDAKPSDHLKEWSSRVGRFSILSLSIVYSLIFLLDPWDFTFGNSRMAFPLIEHLFLLMIALYAYAQQLPWGWRQLAKGVLIGAILVGCVRPGHLAWIPSDFGKEREALAWIEETVHRELGVHPDLKVCIGGESYWQSVRRLVGPTLYRQRMILGDEVTVVPKNCHVLIWNGGTDLSADSWSNLRGFELQGELYWLYSRKPRE